jgi:hypothetical protein
MKYLWTERVLVKFDALKIKYQKVTLIMATPSDNFRLLDTPTPFNMFNTACCNHSEQQKNCAIKDMFSDPNNARFKVFGRPANYSGYECDQRPDNTYRFMVQGSRNPVDCQLSQPYITYSGKNDTIDYMAGCGSEKYLGYNRNGRFIKNIYGTEMPAQFLD